MTITDALIKAAIKDRLAEGSPASTRILARQKFSLTAKDWKASLKSLTNDGLIDGWIITRGARRSERLGAHHWRYEWDYSLLYFRSVREITDGGSSSEDDLNAVLESCAAAFEQSPTLDFDEPYDMDDGYTLSFDEHKELQIALIDTLASETHFVQGKLTCILTKQRT